FALQTPGAGHRAAMGGEGCGSEDKARPIQHPPIPPPVIPEFAEQMSGTQKAQQYQVLPGSRSSPMAKPGGRAMSFRKELIRPSPPTGILPHILLTGAAPVPFGL
ncbi:hypothetical protein HHI_16005, partial [Hyphomonas hirschiana VP5]